MKKFFKSAIIFFVFMIFQGIFINSVFAEKFLPTGESAYLLDEISGVNSDPIKIHFFRPINWKDGDKIFIFFHGSDRGAKARIKGLKKDAAEKNILLICPEFTKEKYPGNRYYSYGNIMYGKNYLKSVPKDEWTINAVNRIIDDVKNKTGAKKSKIIFFGHSAGGQFMHRYLLFSEKIKADLVIAANSGFYTMPDENENFPYGIKNVPVTEKSLKKAFEQNVIIMIGEKDIERKKISMRPEKADAQGLNRMERGKKFFSESKEKAAKIHAKFNWKFVMVPKVGHTGNSMARYAFKFI